MNKVKLTGASFDEFQYRRYIYIRDYLKLLNTISCGKGLRVCHMRSKMDQQVLLLGRNGKPYGVHDFVFFYRSLRMAVGLVALSCVLLPRFVIYSVGISATFYGIMRSQKSNSEVEQPPSAFLLLKVILLPSTLWVLGVCVLISPVVSVDLALLMIPMTPWFLERICSSQRLGKIVDLLDFVERSKPIIAQEEQNGPVNLQDERIYVYVNAHRRCERV